MSFRRRLIHAINQPFQDFTARMRAIAVRRMKIGGNASARKIAEDLRLQTLRLQGVKARQQWKRWYQANRKHQRQMAAYRRLGWSMGPTPHSLKREWVR